VIHLARCWCMILLLIELSTKEKSCFIKSGHGRLSKFWKKTVEGTLKPCLVTEGKILKPIDDEDGQLTLSGIKSSHGLSPLELTMMLRKCHMGFIQTSKNCSHLIIRCLTYTTDFLSGAVVLSSFFLITMAISN
jgi:hypothetical protein